MQASNDIADYVNDNNLFDDINTFYSLSSQAFDTANQLRELRNEINDLNAEIERLATTPRRVEDGNDTEAEAIKQKLLNTIILIRNIEGCQKIFLVVIKKYFILLILEY